MDNKFCFDLDLPVSINLSEIDRLQSLPSKSECDVYTLCVDKDLNSFLEKYQLAISHSQAFYTPPHTSLLMHIDGDQSSKVKINYVFGAKGSTMRWFKEKNPGTAQVHKNQLGTPYLLYQKKDVQFMYSAEVKRPSMVEVGVPHNVVNATDESRWCLSYLLMDLYNKKTVVWEDACQRLGKFIVRKNQIQNHGAVL